jgi:hypothetical protein
MIDKEDQPTSLFTLRLWQAQTPQGDFEWRGKLQSLPGGEVVMFRGWQQLIESLEVFVNQSDD